MFAVFETKITNLNWYVGYGYVFDEFCPHKMPAKHISINFQ